MCLVEGYVHGAASEHLFHAPGWSVAATSVMAMVGAARWGTVRERERGEGERCEDARFRMGGRDNLVGRRRVARWPACGRSGHGRRGRVQHVSCEQEVGGNLLVGWVEHY